MLAKLCDSGASFESVADLCEMAAHRDERIKAFAAGAPLRIAACYPRVVRGLFQQCGAPLPQEGAEVLNMRTQTAEEVVAGMLKEEIPVSTRMGLAKRRPVCYTGSNDWAMGAAESIPYVSVEEYLAFEESAQVRHEVLRRIYHSCHGRRHAECTAGSK